MATKTDAVSLYLTAIWQAATATTLTGVQVVDGPQANSVAANDWLFVAFDGDVPDEGNEAIAATQDLMAFARTKQEDAEVTCAVVCRRGDTDVPTARARAYAIFSAAEDVLRADMQLGGLVMHAFVSAHQYSPAQTAQGARVRLTFTVTYKAQI
jgi:hypothetical protein